MKLTLSPGTLCCTRIMFNEHIRNQSFPLQTRTFIKALGTALELGSAPEKESQSHGMSLWSPSWKRLIVLLIQGRKLEILVKTAGGVPILSP